MQPARGAGQAWRPIPALGPVGPIVTPSFPGILLQRLLLAARGARPLTPVVFPQYARERSAVLPFLRTKDPPRRREVLASFRSLGGGGGAPTQSIRAVSHPHRPRAPTVEALVGGTFPGTEAFLLLQG